MFWFSVHAEKLKLRLYCRIMPMFAANTLVTNVTKVVRTDTEQISF